MTEMLTRNFIDACVASANKLKDGNKQLGTFLSVRKEGGYRIKLTLANLASSDDHRPTQTPYLHA
ncbi:hypothetical protein BDZ90DRAFT_235054 [Jaminaea rosea]|uniref:Velvet domain-containing protein n=1 Tax=Jaminaea rosea TaxID=1569628 RepID=A0A316UGI6_9BASI|nr:hypothetical protein BDZ90DRAFT_235054 [Jaminaea rosea]PWN24320.1 hypothetical protein BDZ90DRAFT_235054 [Jaminaea rosea]